MTTHQIVVMGTFVIALTFSHGICHPALTKVTEREYDAFQPNLFLERKQQRVCFSKEREEEKKEKRGLSRCVEVKRGGR